jgi:hypothetical protein
MTTMLERNDNAVHQARKPARMLLAGAALGAVSGSLSGAGPLHQLSSWFRGTSGIRGYLPDWVQMVFYEPLTSPAPFVFFVALAVMFSTWGGWPLRRLPRLLAVVAVAWVCAYLVAYVTVLSFDQRAIFGLSSPDADGCPTSIFGTPATVPAGRAEICNELNQYRTEIEPIFKRLSIFVNVSAGVAAGLVGSLITALGLAFLSRRHRSLEAVLLIVLAGTLAGAALGWATGGHLGLFVVWQTAVAAAIARPFAVAPDTAGTS